MAAATGDGSPVHLVTGSDDVLLADGARELVHRLVGDADPNEVLDEFSGDDYELGDVLLAASTVSMFGSRVVVARNAGRFTTAELAPLLAHLESPPPDTVLVVVWDAPVTSGAKRSPLPKKLRDAVRDAGGEVHNFDAPGGKGRSAWIDDQLAAATVRLDPRARRVLIERLGDDVNRLGGILAVLDATFGASTVGADDVEPYLGDAGAVPPWDLTDAIDSGDVVGAVTNLQRLLGGGARHPLQVMVTLVSHVERMVRLDGAGVRTDAEAAQLLGMKGSTFPAKKALAQSGRLGSARLARALTLVATADVDVRGRTAQDATAVLETLVARLASLSGRSRSGARR